MVELMREIERRGRCTRPVPSMVEKVEPLPGWVSGGGYPRGEGDVRERKGQVRANGQVPLWEGASGGPGVRCCRRKR